MKKLISFILVVAFLVLFVNLSYADTTYEYKVFFKKITPIDQISNQPEYDTNVTIDGNKINIGESITTTNPYCIIDMKSYKDDILVYSGYNEKFLKKGLKIIFVKVEKQNEIGEYDNLYYWFYFVVSRSEIISTPTPTITDEPTITPMITLPNTPPEPTETIITPTLNPTISPVLPSNEPSNSKNKTSKLLANNKNLPKTGEEKPLFMLVSGGCIMLLGTLYLVAKLKK
jgi:LPXTG-motif cell wall-anchored protein